MAITLSQQEIDAAVRDAWGDELARLWISMNRPRCERCNTPLEPCYLDKNQRRVGVHKCGKCRIMDLCGGW